jgi:hypothetical protein
MPLKRSKPAPPPSDFVTVVSLKVTFQEDDKPPRVTLVYQPCDEHGKPQSSGAVAVQITGDALADLFPGGGQGLRKAALAALQTQDKDLAGLIT